MPHTPAITIKLFASLAETHGWRERICPLPVHATVSEIWTAQTGERALPARVLCAVNMNYCDPETEVHAGDEVAFFPPVTGGSA